MGEHDCTLGYDEVSWNAELVLYRRRLKRVTPMVHELRCVVHLWLPGSLHTCTSASGWVGGGQLVREGERGEVRSWEEGEWDGLLGRLSSI